MQQTNLNITDLNNHIQQLGVTIEDGPEKQTLGQKDKRPQRLSYRGSKRQDMAATTSQTTQNNEHRECGRCTRTSEYSLCSSCDERINVKTTILDNVYHRDGDDAARALLSEFQEASWFQEGDLNRIAARSSVLSRPNPPEKPLEYDDEGQVVFDA